MCIDFDGEFLLPTGSVGDFAVIACDQFSSRSEYWRELEHIMPRGSALELILPECFLSETESRIKSIEAASRAMAESGRFRAYRGAVAVTRTTIYGRTRRGVVATVNLDDYDYRLGSNALIRASERTIEERIPPRVRIREAIDIELPHILLLVDDGDGLLNAAVERSNKTPIYDADLKGDGGHISGRLIAAGDTGELYDAVDTLIKQSVNKFGSPLFALVGDGNHSLATAKYCREHNPTELNGGALVEIINIYDDGLVFEPIHRLVKAEDPQAFVAALKASMHGDAETSIFAPDESKISVPQDKVAAIKAVDEFCEKYVADNGGYIEYVHGEAALKRSGCVGIRMRGVEKSELFEYVVKCGALPKKTFSLGEAEEKRFYLEARKIK